jgi:NTE family protein
LPSLAGSIKASAEPAPSAAPVKAPDAGARVIPYPAPEPFGTGKTRALALGGGGEWFEAWQLAYVTTLAKGGVDLATAEAVVGTSAGSRSVPC